MIPSSYWRKSWGAFVKPNTGTFEILDIACLQEPASQRIVHLYQLDVRCTACDHAFAARDGRGMATVIGARVLNCPICSSSQAVANTELARFVSQGAAGKGPRVLQDAAVPVHAVA